MPASSPSPTARRARLLLFALLLGLLLTTTSCGRSPAEMETSFGEIEKGMLAAEIRDRLGEPERVESSPQIPDLEHWKYFEDRFTVSLLQGRVLGKFDAGPAQDVDGPGDATE